MYRARLIPLLLLLTPFSASGYNVKIGVAYPLPRIVVDGDLSDWPADMTRYPLRFQEHGDPLTGTGDFTGFFRVGYDPERGHLFVAVEVEDDSVLPYQPTEKASYDTQDGCEVYISFEWNGRMMPPIQYHIWGNHRGIYATPSDAASVEDAVVAAHWGDRGYLFEWSIDIGRASRGRVQLSPGLHIGFDVSIWDRDADGSASWIAWSREGDKYILAERLGTLFLETGNEPLILLLDRIGSTVEERVEVSVDELRRSTGYQLFFTGVLLAFTLLHLLLFLFETQSRANLFYALYTGSIGMAIFSGFQFGFSPTADSDLVGLVKTWAVCLGILFGLRFLHSLFSPRWPRRLWFYAALLTGTGALIFVDLYSDVALHSRVGNVAQYALGIIGLILVIETMIALIRALLQWRSGVWIVCLGFILFNLNTAPFIWQDQIGLSRLYWVLLPLISMSVYLARTVSHANRDLKTQLKQIRELSAKTQEQNRALEEANRLIQEANRLKSDFLARMSHDLRTPMNAIIGYTRILLRQVKDILTERQYRNLDNIQISANNLLSLINDILDLSKIEAGRIDLKPDAVDLKQLAADCIVSVESLVKPGVQLEQQLEDVYPVHTDEDRIRRVVMNLLSNALKFTEKGSITVSLKPVDYGVELSVADTGLGIPSEDLPHIFDEFRQVESEGGKTQEGTGLGLSIAKKSVELLGGTISVESEIGEGTKFTLRIMDYEEEKAE